ncbi:unnamed protein product [Paramecium pentaurelia]|uniref:Uncharacterized protein n=1 Tax=Paramecium pentaurelia TaxID=43138 RepID=A0A8S1VF17_9CILI|nr:unnamed protein product [Paramecium pentaurelia]
MGSTVKQYGLNKKLKDSYTLSLLKLQKREMYIFIQPIINSQFTLLFNQMQKPKMIENAKDFSCSKGHKLPVFIITLDPKLSRNQRPMCTEYLENTDINDKVVGLQKTIQLIEDNQVKKMEKVETIITNQIKIIEQLHSNVDQKKTHLLQQLEQLINIIIEWIQNLQQQISQCSQYSLFIYLFIYYGQYSFFFFEPLTVFLFILGSYLNYSSFQRCYSICIYSSQSEPSCVQVYNLGNQQFRFHNSFLIKKQITFPIFVFIQSQYIGIINQFTIAIDKDCSTLVAGFDQLIKVFEQGMIKQILTLNQHQDSLFTLNFMQNKQFISESYDNSIIIWKYNKNNLWYYQQILNGHNNSIQYLIINSNEDLIISGSDDNTIKFWVNKNEWLCQQKINDHSNSVYGLSLNQQQNRVVSCGSDEYILIIEQSEQNKKLKVIQRITIDSYGCRVCFIDNNMFTFSVFEINNKNKQFTKTRDIPIKSGSDGYTKFLQQYKNQKCILESKNGEYVNLIRKKQNGKFLTEQSIHFEINQLYGNMSNGNDGEYLITWDKKSKQIQIRRYKDI